MIRLLHSPPLSGDLPTSQGRPDPAPSGSGEKSNNESDNVDAREENVNTASDYPKLGDFSSLWGLLGQTSAPTDPKVDRQCQDDITSQPSPAKPKPIEILKRPSKAYDGTKDLLGPEQAAAAPTNANTGHDRLQNASSSRPVSEKRKAPKVLKRASGNINNAGSFTKTQPPAAPGAIPIPDTPKARRFKGEAETKTSINDCNNGSKSTTETSTSQSGAEADSEGNLNIFDPPLRKQAGATSLIPPQVGTSTTISPLDTPPSSYDSVEGVLNPEVVKTLPKSSRISVQPIAYKSAADRRVGLLTKLLKEFPDYAEIVSQVGRPMKNRAKDPSSRPIHVFVDISNIMIGFHNSVKESRSIPINTRIPRLPLSFENFALILERGRQATKRVLVGSDRFAAIDEAEKIGYEANILGRVYKAKHMTPRKSRFRKAHTPGSQEGAGAGCSETNSAAQERWVEQGVDEILHLKILESLVDTDEPTTIVLATGDAAEAEYSDGFMKMVERALQRGWAVELVSFLQTTSLAYRKDKFRAKWGDQFKMINLEGYIEELLKM